MVFDSPIDLSSASPEATPTAAAKDLPPETLALAVYANLAPPELVRVRGKLYLPDDKLAELKTDPIAAFDRLDQLFVCAAKPLKTKLVSTPLTEIAGASVLRQWHTVDPFAQDDLDALGGRLRMYAKETSRLGCGYEDAASLGHDPAIRHHDDKQGTPGELLSWNPTAVDRSLHNVVDDVQHQRVRHRVLAYFHDEEPIALPGAPATRGLTEKFTGKPTTIVGRIEHSSNRGPYFLLRVLKDNRLLKVTYKLHQRPSVISAHDLNRPVKVGVTPVQWSVAACVVTKHHVLGAIHV